MTLDESTKHEAIRLRLEERLSIDEIRERIRISVGSLSAILRPYPLTADEIKQKMSESSLQNNPLRKYHVVQSKFAMFVADEELSTERKGRIAEAAVLFRLALLGYDVWHSQFEGHKVDWLVTLPFSSMHIRLQVKWARRGDEGRPFVALNNGEHGRLRLISSEACDFVIGYDLESDTAFVLPIDVCLGKATKSCDADYAEAWHLLSANV